MRAYIASLLVFSALTAYGKDPLTLEELKNSADQICNGRVNLVEETKYCFNHECTNFRIDSIAHLQATCNDENVAIKASFFYYAYTEGTEPPLPYGHLPAPQPGEVGTVYLNKGAIIYPNGWNPEPNLVHINDI